MASAFTPVFNAETGRFEPGPGNIVYVDIDAVGGADGTSWTDAYTTVNAGIDGAVDGDRVWVAAGTYDEAIINFDSKSIELECVDGVTLRTSSTRIIYAGEGKDIGIHGAVFDAEDQDITAVCQFKGGAAVLTGCTFINTNANDVCLQHKTESGKAAESLRVIGCAFDRWINAQDSDWVRLENCHLEGSAYLYANNNTAVYVNGCSFGTSSAPEDLGATDAAVKIVDAVTAEIRNCSAVMKAGLAAFRIEPANVDTISPVIADCSVVYTTYGGDGKYAYFIGYDSEQTNQPIDPVIERCKLYTPREPTGTKTFHGLFIGWALNPTIRDCYSYGGGYNASIKNSTTPRVYGCTLSEPNQQCLVDKANTGGRYYDNTMYCTGTGNAAMRVALGDGDEPVVDSRWYDNTIYVEDSAYAVQVDSADFDQDDIITNPSPFMPFYDDLPGGRRWWKNTMQNILFYNNTYYVDTQASNLVFVAESASNALATVQAHPDNAKGYYWEADGSTVVNVVT